jgi:hypothetical protein
MVNVCIVGYYNRHNLGDDMFIEAFPLMMPSHVCTYICSDDIDLTLLKYYDVVVIGGGDLINDYFIKLIKTIRKHFEGPIVGLSLGLPYRELISKNYLSTFDSLYVRSKSYLLDLQHAMGSRHIHYLPDFVMRLPPPPKLDVGSGKKDTIGVFLASAFNKPAIIFNLCLSFREILNNTGYKLHLVCFDTSDTGNSDFTINKNVKESLLDFSDRIINDTNRYNSMEMM